MAHDRHDRRRKGWRAEEETVLRIAAAERAVLNAAEAWADAPDIDQRSVDVLIDAVDALREARK
jgi:hypothetical protein